MCGALCDMLVDPALDPSSFPKTTSGLTKALWAVLHVNGINGEGSNLGHGSSLFRTPGSTLHPSSLSARPS